MTVIQYFAYGSNMLTERLLARCSSAKTREVARVDSYALTFCKKSHDGSGKATLRPEPERQVFGVLFDLNENELKNLDEAEGAGNGYDRIVDFRVRIQGSYEPQRAITYLASPNVIDLNLKPYDWYLRLVLAGARQHGLPLQYIREIEAMQCIADPKPNRKSRLEALRLLGGPAR
jgi:gamma-glutamylcyclotransferase